MVARVQRPGNWSTLHLPTNRAFVVQFADGTPGEGILRGRAEHLDSGRIIHFDSLNDLDSFIEGVLGALPTRERAVENPA